VGKRFVKASSVEVAETRWLWSTRDAGTGLQTDQIQAAILHALFEEQRATNDLLRSIVQRLDMLDRDGLHTVIRHHRREVATKNAAARAAAKARREGRS
jgi:hypothetical protein